MTTTGLGHLEDRLHELERQVLREQRFIHDFIERANLMVVGLDAEGRVTVFNRKAEAVTGTSKEQVVGSTLAAVFGPEAGNTVHELVEKFNACGGNGFRCETQLVTPAGERKTIAWNASCLVDGDDVVGLMAFGEDQTALRHEQEHARWVEAMGFLQRFSGKLAHDFNNLLGTLLGYASMLRMTLEQGSKEREYAESVEAGVRRCAAVLSRLIDFGLGGSPRPQVFEFGPVVQRAVQRWRSEAPSTIEVAYTPADGAVHVKADPSQLEQVLGEVVANSVEAMPDGGRIEVVAGTMFADDEFCAERPGLARGWYATLRVTDTGPGVPPEDAHDLLVPFSSSKQGRCVGLGLSVAYGILRRNGGWIEMARNVEPAATPAAGTTVPGTTVTMYLPLDASKHECPAPDRPQRTGPQTVLLVDDEKAVVEAVSDMLKHLGYLVLTAGDGHEALRIYEEHRANVDLIILDMIMPRKGGREAYEDLKRIQPDVKVLLTSGFDKQKAVAKDMCREGAVGFVEKPYGLSDLSKLIRQAIEQHS